MPELPWKTASEAPPPPDTEIVVMASRLTLTSVRDVPAFLRAALAIRRQVLASPGADVVRGAVKDIVETLDRSIIAAYQTFLDQVRGSDDISFRLVVGLLGKEVHREAEVTAVLAVPGS